MAVIIPGAIWRPDPVSQTPIGDLRWIICHTIVGTVASSISGRHYHVYVKADGTYIQIQDLALRSAASVDANPYSIAIVAEDKGPRFPTWTGNDVPAYTEEQVDALEFILSWTLARYGLPIQAISTSRYGEMDGCGWHRLGIPGNFPPSWPLWGRQSGGQTWSTTTGKACPGDRRINQLVDRIIPAITPPEEHDVRPDPDARYLPFEFSKVTSTGTTPALDVVTNQSRQSPTQVTTTTVSKVTGGTGTPVLQTAALVAEASGGVIGSIPWKAGGGHYGSVWNVEPTGWGGTGDQFDQRCVGAVFTATGNGYWLVSDKGGVFTFGDAKPFTGDVWQRNVVGAKRATDGKLVVVLADGSEVIG